jgi:putative transcriptional regulator
MAGKKPINRIKVVLVEQGVTQKELARLVDRTETTISRICNNDSQPTLELLRQIAEVIDVDIRELLISTKPK